MIGGFIITGSDPKRVVLRAIGPSLSAAGVAGALQDPTLELINQSGAILAANDNWQENAAAITATGVPPSHPLEAAVTTELAPGAYTAIVRGKNATSGVGLIEAYDLEPTKGQLANISTRGVIGRGDSILIGGFIAGGGGGGGTRVLIRGLGPSLAAAGVNEVIADPQLELRDPNGALVSANGDWRETQQSEIEATGVPPVRNEESAIVFALAPGPYTVLLRGAGGTAGVGLVEVYWLKIED